MRALALLLCLSACAPTTRDLRVGSKRFTESRVLGEIAVLVAEETGAKIEPRTEFGGTMLAWNALRAGAIDLYPDYTGTVINEILSGTPIQSAEELEQAFGEHGISSTDPLGFNNTYAIGLREERAAKLGIERVSDLRNHPDLRFGFTNEFMNRADGWPGLRESYALPQTDANGLDHDVAYRALESGALDVIDLYSTDAEIDYYGLRVLEDDLEYFPRYDAVFLYRTELRATHPGLVKALESLAGKIPREAMVAMNVRATLDLVPETIVAADFVRERLGIQATTNARSLSSRLWLRTKEHLALVLLSLLAAILVAIPLGIFASRRQRLGQVVLALTGILQTIPSLALLVVMIPLLKALGAPSAYLIGSAPAILALFLYGLLPIVRNTYQGLNDIPPELRDAAEALGLPARTKLRRLELPLASRAILAGIKTSAVINVGTATLGALIGAGGYGQAILTGITLDDTALILEGAIPAALLALVIQALFELSERVLVPRALRA